MFVNNSEKGLRTNTMQISFILDLVSLKEGSDFSIATTVKK